MRLPHTDLRELAPSQALATDEVHIHVADFGGRPVDVPAMFAALSEEERSRASRFRFVEHRDRFVARRGLLRTLLGGYLRKTPQEIELGAGPYGKPELAGVHEGPRLGFNLSHSADIAVFAFSWDRNVGVDVERVRFDLDLLALSERFFAPGEKQQLAELSDAHLAEAFFRCWTRKEAVVKSHGAGLSLPLDSFEVSVHPEGASSLKWLVPSDGPEWRLETLLPGSGFIAALAVQGAPWNLAVLRVGDHPLEALAASASC